MNLCSVNAFFISMIPSSIADIYVKKNQVKLIEFFENNSLL